MILRRLLFVTPTGILGGGERSLLDIMASLRAFAPTVQPRFSQVVSYNECLFTCDRGFDTFVNTHEGPRNTSSSITAPV